MSVSPSCQPWRPTRRLWLVLWILVGLAAACSDNGQRGCMLCVGAGVIVGQGIAEVGKEDLRRLEACGVCPSGERCNPFDTPPRCRPDPAGVGSPCGKFAEAERAFTCKAGTYCKAATTVRACAPLEPEGAPCSDYDVCEAHLYCKGLTGSRGTCRPRLPEGAACPGGDPDCREGLICRFGRKPNRCSQRALEHEACEEDHDCAAGFKCDCTTRPCRCGARTAEGKACRSDADCWGVFLSCDPLSKKCWRPGR